MRKGADTNYFIWVIFFLALAFVVIAFVRAASEKMGKVSLDKIECSDKDCCVTIMDEGKQKCTSEQCKNACLRNNEYCILEEEVCISKECAKNCIGCNEDECNLWINTYEANQKEWCKWKEVNAPYVGKTGVCCALYEENGEIKYAEEYCKT